MELSLAYVFAAVLIGGLIGLAKRNHQQGWRKDRSSTFERQSSAALEVFYARQEIPVSNGPLQHLSDLARLQQALTADGEAVKPSKQEETVPTR